MPRNAAFTTSDGGAVLGENGEIAEWCRHHRRASCGSTFRCFGCVRIDLDQAADAPVLRTSATGARPRAGARTRASI